MRRDLSAMACLLCGISLLGLSCAASWMGVGGVHERAVMSDAYGNKLFLFADLDAEQVPEIPIPARLRPCCAFGTELGVKLGALPMPGFRIGNMIGPEDIGPHTFDAGMLSLGESQTGNIFGDESNGLIYTCRGGMIDTAHLRDYADWMLFFSSWIGRFLDDGNSVVLSDEAGERRVVLAPIDPALLQRHGRRPLTIAIAEYITFRLSVWHEIATWYSWAAIPIFPERASAFSPEDLYSNILGAKIVRSIIEVGAASSPDVYGASVDRWTDEVLRILGALDAEAGEQVAVALDGAWWDSTKRLPDPTLLKRRNIGIGAEISPWLASDAGVQGLDELLEPHCKEQRPRVVLGNPDTFAGVPLEQLIKLEINVSDKVEGFPFPRSPNRLVTQVDFPFIVETIQNEMLSEFGPRSDRPD